VLLDAAVEKVMGYTIVLRLARVIAYAVVVKGRDAAL